jgi:glucose/mannose-6-phosphate isomerase
MSGSVDTDALSSAAVDGVDQEGLLTDILDLPEHLRDAMWRVDSANLQPWDSPGGLVVAGMGGSALGGELARACLGDQASRPILATRGYGLPPWTTPEVTVLCCSYSGNTEETLACFEAAGFLGARRVVVTSGGQLAEDARSEGVPVIPMPGGFEPRSAIGYMVVAALEVAAACGVAGRMASQIDVAAAHLDALCGQWGPDAPADSLAKELAHALHGSVPIVAGTGLTTPIAYRWKTQLNQNAKLPAFSSELPELDHNEVVGWTGAPGLGRFSAIVLDDCDNHPRVSERIELTCSLISERAHAVKVVPTLGQGTVERVMSLVLLGDLVSLYLAVLQGIDPSPVAIIDELKARLAQR